jgi:hypothetical protein
MTSRVLLFVCVLVIQTVSAQDKRSELKLITAKKGSGWYEIYAAPSKHVLIHVTGSRVSTLDVSVEFPYSVSLTESPTPHYAAVLLFTNRQYALVDSFGVTTSGSVEATDPETHQRLLDDAAKGHAIGEKLAKDIWGDRQ